MTAPNPAQAQTSPPRKPGIGSVQNHTMYMESIKTKSSRGALAIELQDKILLDDSEVFTRLRMKDVPDSFVEACATTFHQELAVQIEELKRLERQANPTATKSPLEGKPTREEKKMYAPLVSSSLPVSSLIP